MTCLGRRLAITTQISCNGIVVCLTNYMGILNAGQLWHLFVKCRKWRSKFPGHFIAGATWSQNWMTKKYKNSLSNGRINHQKSKINNWNDQQFSTCANINSNLTTVASIWMPWSSQHIPMEILIVQLIFRKWDHRKDVGKNISNFYWGIF